MTKKKGSTPSGKPTSVRSGEGVKRREERRGEERGVHSGGLTKTGNDTGPPSARRQVTRCRLGSQRDEPDSPSASESTLGTWEMGDWGGQCLDFSSHEVFHEGSEFRGVFGNLYGMDALLLLDCPQEKPKPEYWCQVEDLHKEHWGLVSLETIFSSRNRALCQQRKKEQTQRNPGSDPDQVHKQLTVIQK